jgi:hypothetical protein
VNPTAAELAFFLRKQARKNLKLLVGYLAFLALMVLGYAYLFQFLMWHLERRTYSLIAGIYWTITVMTTLGFGDITVHSDTGFLFATIVTISGVVFLLMLLPFVLVSLFIAPWIEQSMRFRPKRELPAHTRGHVLIFGPDAVTRAFMRKLEGRQVPFVVVARDPEEAFPAGTGRDSGPLRQRPRTGRSSRMPGGAARGFVTNLNDPESVNLCTHRAEARGRAHCGACGRFRARGPAARRPATHVIPLPQILGRHLADPRHRLRGGGPRARRVRQPADREMPV